MRALSASELLAVWDRGLGQPLAGRAVLLLAAACPDMSLDALAQLSLGQRDARLLELRQWLFGTQLVSVAVCAQCRERLELTFDVADIRTAEMPASSGSVLQTDGYEVRFRVPNSDDLIAIAVTQDIDAMRQLLLARCTLDVRCNGAEQSVEQLPAQIVDALTQSMARADPQADVQLQVTCPACGGTCLATFDIASFLWSEITDWAQRLLREIHAIASAYGWREADIVAMSAQRRQLYVDMIGGYNT
jgi:hypothetical protein